MSPVPQGSSQRDGVRRNAERWNRALDASTLRAEMKRAMERGKLEPLNVARIQPQPVKLEGSRFVVSVRVGGRLRRTTRLVVKGFGDDRAGQIFENHRKLWNEGLGSEGGIRTAKPLGVLDGLGAIVMEWLPGDQAQRTDKEAAARKGEAAAHLHACGATLAPRVELETVLDDVMKRARGLKKKDIELGGRAERIVRRMIELRPLIETDRYGPVHGDLGHSPFLFSGEEIYLIDWDTSCHFDPAFDVGYHLSQLHRWQLTSGIDTTSSRERYLDAYLAASGDSGLGGRVSFFKGIVDLIKASTMAHKGKSGWKRVVPAQVRWAEDSVKQLA
jgi:Phosphotransferase enzyme family